MLEHCFFIKRKKDKKRAKNKTYITLLKVQHYFELYHAFLKGYEKGHIKNIEEKNYKEILLNKMPEILNSDYSEIIECLENCKELDLYTKIVKADNDFHYFILSLQEMNNVLKESRKNNVKLEIPLETSLQDRIKAEAEFTAKALNMLSEASLPLIESMSSIVVSQLKASLKSSSETVNQIQELIKEKYPRRSYLTIPNTSYVSLYN